VPSWGWKSLAVKYVGNALRKFSFFPDGSIGEGVELGNEEKINSLLQGYLNSKKIKEQKEFLISSIKQNIKERVLGRNDD